MSAREESQEIGRRFVFAVAKFFDALRRPNGVKIYQLISNAYEPNLRQFCDIIIESQTISFDIVFLRYPIDGEAKVVYAECKFAQESSARNLKAYYEEFLLKAYHVLGLRQHQNSEFLFVTNVPLTKRTRRYSEDFTSLHNLLISRLGEPIDENRVPIMLSSVNSFILPEWFINLNLRRE